VIEVECVYAELFGQGWKDRLLALRVEARAVATRQERPSVCRKGAMRNCTMCDSEAHS